MKTLIRAFGVCWIALVLVSFPMSRNPSAAFIGWQTFSNCGANNNTGVFDASPESNSSFDATPIGSISFGGAHLTGVIGAAASSSG